MEITPRNLTLINGARPVPSAFARALAMAGGGLKAFWRTLVCCAHREPKSLLVRESSGLGDRRFVSVVQFERQRFLIGSSPSSITLLARLPDVGATTKSGGGPTTSEGKEQ